MTVTIDSALPNRLPVSILGGMLGAGKTTAVNHILHTLRESDPAEADGTWVIVNEFGEVGLDGSYIIGQDVIEIAGGCFCCEHKGDLVATLLEKILPNKGRIARILIETTGVADPGQIKPLFMAEGDISENFELLGVITMIDLENFSRQMKYDLDLIRQQTLAADLVALNKRDRVELDTQKEAEQLVQSINPGVEVIAIERAVMSLEQIFRQRSRIIEELDVVFSAHAHHHEGEHNHHDHDTTGPYQSVSFRRSGVMSRELLNVWLGGIVFEYGEDLCRTKAQVRVRDNVGETTYQMESVHFSVETKERNDLPESDNRMVMIFLRGTLDPAELEAGFNACFLPV